MSYAEYVVGDIKNRNRIYENGKFKLSGERRECYRSLFTFGEELKRWVDNTGSVKGFIGPHIAEQFVVDVDYDGDLNKAKEETERIVGHLTIMHEVPVSYMRIAFSGSKGFHIAIPIQCFIENPKPTENFHEVILGIAHDLLDGFGGVDFKIYEPRRIFRMVNTINGKTGLYKIPLTIDELRTLTVDEIRGLAKAERKVYQLPVDEMTVVDALNELFLKYSAPKKAAVVRAEPDSIISGMSSGGRNDALAKLTGVFISKGFDEAYTLEFMRMWNDRNTPPLEDDEVCETVAKLFRSYGGVKEMRIVDIRQAGFDYMAYVKRMQGAKVKLGIPDLDAKIRGVCPGEVAYILGRTGVGKSAFLQWSGRNYATDTGEPTLMMSLEMPSSMVFERDYQMAQSISGFDVERIFNENDMTETVERLYESNPSFYIADQPGLSLDDVRAYVRHGETQIYKRQTGLVLIDYLGLIRDKGRDIYESVSRVARELKNVAKELDVPIIALVQVSRKYANTEELALEAARDSGAIEEAADFVLGLWRDTDQITGNTGQDSINMRLAILKNRKGALGDWRVQMDRKSLNFSVVPDGAKLFGRDEEREPNF